jgi:CRP-like cAMP-binding protein
MASLSEGSTQPRLTGVALRNLAKANRPVVTKPVPPTAARIAGREDAFLRKGPRANRLASASTVAGKALWQGGSAVVRTIGWLMTSDSGARPAARAGSWAQRNEDKLPVLAAASRYAILSNRFNAVAPLDEEEREALKKLDYAQRRIHQAGSDIVIEGEQPPPVFIVSGWASRVRVLSTGRRQILGLLIPGDGIGFHSETEPVSAATVTAITTLETIDASVLIQLAREAERFPGIALALERIAAQEDVFSDNQILRLGALSERRRLAHLLLELQWRLGEVGLGNDQVFPLPLTNETIADTLGMEPVDVRRAMAALRSRRMFSLRYGCATLLSKKKIDLEGDFRPPEISAGGREGFRSLAAH